MSVSNIPEKTKLLLWGKAAGRCQYRGCNSPLWLDTHTQTEFNAAYIAHIIADSPGGPRGHKTLSEQLKSDLSNLMLLCDQHHRLIDKVNVTEHPPELLRSMKSMHEERIELLSSLQAEHQSEILFYGARIGEHGTPFSIEQAAQAMLPDWYPASRNPIRIGTINSAFDDRSPEFWNTESENLRKHFSDRLNQRLELGTIQHLSVFGLAPQPLLILLGSLLSDIPNTQIYHRFREPQDWRWREHPTDFQLDICRPDSTNGKPALVFGLTASVTHDRIKAVLGPDVSVWTITVPQPKHDAIPSKDGLSQFRVKLRLLLNEIKEKHGQNTELHVFPAMGVSTAIEFGRVRQPKADMPLVIYDQNVAIGGFNYALTI